VGARFEAERNHKRLGARISGAAAAFAGAVRLIVGPYATTGALSSIFLHAAALLGLALLLVTPERKERPAIITAVNPGEVASVGEEVADIDMKADPAPVIDTSRSVLNPGGSSGDFEPDLSMLTGEPGGQGRGSGSGQGDGVGADIAGRVSAAGGQGGALQISLAWEDVNDLDLSVRTPKGEILNYRTLMTSDGGVLDIDMNALGSVNLTTQPVENITWPKRVPPDGEYIVRVHYFASRRQAPRSPAFRVRLQVADEARLLSGRLGREGQYLEVARIQVADSRLAKLETDIKPYEPTSQEIAQISQKRTENRERFAREALEDAKAAQDAALKAGKLRRLIERFYGTDAADEAQTLLNEIEERV
jgi:hypothetical protein